MPDKNAFYFFISGTIHRFWYTSIQNWINDLYQRQIRVNNRSIMFPWSHRFRVCLFLSLSRLFVLNPIGFGFGPTRRWSSDVFKIWIRFFSSLGQLCDIWIIQTSMVVFRSHFGCHGSVLLLLCDDLHFTLLSRLTVKLSIKRQKFYSKKISLEISSMSFVFAFA